MDYSSEVRRRFGSQLEAAELQDDLPGLVAGEAQDRALNVWVRFQVEVRGDRIEAARFRVFGCPHTVAAVSWAAEWLQGREVRSLTQLDVRGIAHRFDVPIEKLGKLLTVEDALLACWRQLAHGDEVKGS